MSLSIKTGVFVELHLTKEDAENIVNKTAICQHELKGFSIRITPGINSDLPLIRFNEEEKAFEIRLECLCKTYI